MRDVPESKEQCGLRKQKQLQQPTMPLQPKTKAPLFTTTNQHGEKFSLKDVLGTNIVLYFYPKDDTKTCTKQACELRDNMQRITAHNAVVIGVSPDDEHSHQKFINKYDLNFTLITDTTTKLCNKYDVWHEKTLYGRTYMGVERTTYIINKKGVITHTFEKVRVKGHVDAIIEALKELK